MTFLKITVLTRRGASDPPQEQTEVIDVRIIDRIVPATLAGYEKPVCKLHLSHGDLLHCAGTVDELADAIEKKLA